jgi:hypothetical protein
MAILLEMNRYNEPVLKVLVVGPMRSGTTWISRTLGSARDCAYANEPDNLPGYLAEYAREERSVYPVLRVGETAPPHYERLFDIAFGGHWLPRQGPRWLRAIVRDTPLLARAALSVTATLGPALSRPQHAVVKTVHSVFATEWLAARYDPAVVLVRRNPLNIAASWLELDMGSFGLDRDPLCRTAILEPLHLPKPPATSEYSVEMVAWCVGVMLTEIERLRASQPNWLMADHDAICASPISSFQSLFGELGLVWTEATDRYLERSDRPGEGWSWNRLASEQPERWRKRLNGEVMASLLRVWEEFPVLQDSIDPALTLV